jgi:hypothetical protein
VVEWLPNCDRQSGTGPVAQKLFICYRRDDSAGYAGRLYDRLESEFGSDHLVMDVDSIPLGANFAKVLDDEVAKCDLLLAIIGPGWLEARDEEGKRRLENPQDFVRIEIGTALKRGIPVIPVLLEGTRIPKADQLPDDLKELALRNGLNVRHASFSEDMERLIRGLKREARGIERKAAEEAEARRKAEAERKAAEEAEARRKAEAERKAAEEAEARRKAEDEQARIAALKREAAEAQARAQETAEWGAVAESTNSEVIKAFLQRWPNGQHARKAQTRVAALQKAIAEARIAEGERTQETAEIKQWSDRHRRNNRMRLGIFLGTAAIGIALILAWVAVYQGGPGYALRGDPGQMGPPGPTGPQGPPGPPGLGTRFRFAEFECNGKVCSAECEPDERLVNAFAQFPAGTFTVVSDSGVQYRPLGRSSKFVLVCVPGVPD